MQRYTDIDRDSGVLGFEIFDTSIKIYFKNGGRPYIYSYRGTGPHHVERMKQLAISGEGLNQYINDYVKKAYD